MSEIPVFLTNVTAKSGGPNGRGEFMAMMQSVIVDRDASGAFNASIVQQPPTSIAGERPAQMSPWIMPAWTYDHASAGAEWDAAASSLDVGDELIIGTRATNYVTVRVEDRVLVSNLDNFSGTAVALASGKTDLGTTGEGFERERTLLGYMLYAAFPENAAALSAPEIETYQNVIADAFNIRDASDRSTGIGFEGRGNRVYWFIQFLNPEIADNDTAFSTLPLPLPIFVSPLTTPPLSLVFLYNARRYLADGETVSLAPALYCARIFGPTGAGEVVNTSTWVDDWLAGPGAVRYAWRVSMPLNLNTYVPCHTTLTKATSNFIYTVDERGIANNLVEFTPADWPFLTLSNRSLVRQEMFDSNQKYHEKFLWPAYRQRRGLPMGASTPMHDFIVPLQNDGRRPRHISLMAYSISGPLTQSIIVRIDGVSGRIQSNIATVNGAFAVLRMSDVSQMNQMFNSDSIRSDSRPIVSAPIDTTVRQMRVRFHDLSGNELSNLAVSMWISLDTA
jgi:hypothetical protein